MEHSENPLTSLSQHSIICYSVAIRCSVASSLICTLDIPRMDGYCHISNIYCCKPASCVLCTLLKLTDPLVNFVLTASLEPCIFFLVLTYLHLPNGSIGIGMYFCLCSHDCLSVKLVVSLFCKKIGHANITIVC